MTKYRRYHLAALAPVVGFSVLFLTRDPQPQPRVEPHADPATMLQPAATPPAAYRIEVDVRDVNGAPWPDSVEVVLSQTGSAGSLVWGPFTMPLNPSGHGVEDVGPLQDIDWTDTVWLSVHPLGQVRTDFYTTAENGARALERVVVGKPDPSTSVSVIESGEVVMAPCPEYAKFSVLGASPNRPLTLRVRRMLGNEMHNLEITDNGSTAIYSHTADRAIAAIGFDRNSDKVVFNGTIFRGSGKVIDMDGVASLTLHSLSGTSRFTSVLLIPIASYTPITAAVEQSKTLAAYRAAGKLRHYEMPWNNENKQYTINHLDPGAYKLEIWRLSDFGASPPFTPIFETDVAFSPGQSVTVNIP